MEDVQAISSTGQPGAADDEAALVRAAREDPAAFGALYARYRARLYWYLRTRAATDEDAADLTQQVFLQVWAALPRYRERGRPFAAWLFRIARNVAANAARRRRETIALEAVADTLPANAVGDPEGVALHSEALARLQALLHELDPDRRDLLALRFAAGLTAREIAAIVGGREGAVKRRLSRTIRLLKERYDEG